MIVLYPCIRLKSSFDQYAAKRVQSLPWRKFVPIAACGAMFLANWYIQSSPVSLLVKRISHWAAILTSVATSLGVIKNGTLSLIQNRKANADTLTATSIFASLYLGNPGSALVITMMSTISELLTEHTSQKTKEYIHSVMSLDTTYAWKVNEQGIEEKVELRSSSNR